MNAVDPLLLVLLEQVVFETVNSWKKNEVGLK